MRCVFSAVVAGLLGVAAPAFAQSPVEKGQAVYTAQKCSICHSIGGKGNVKGPLDGIGTKLKAEDIRDWLVNAPAKAAQAKAERKPAMKAFSALPKEDVDALVGYLQTLKK